MCETCLPFDLEQLQKYYVKGLHHLKFPLLCFLCSRSSIVPNHCYEKLFPLSLCFTKCKTDSFLMTLAAKECHLTGEQG